MGRLVILIAIILAALLIWHKIKTAKPEDKKKTIVTSIIAVIIGVLVVLAATGKLNVITALIGGAVAMLPKAANLLRYLPLIQRFRQHAQQQKQQQDYQQQASRKPDSNMTREKAAEVLGVKTDASKDEIIAAHKRMMQKVHPDRGGSDYLAAEINKAKDTLLG